LLGETQQKAVRHRVGCFFVLTASEGEDHSWFAAKMYKGFELFFAANLGSELPQTD
jgi:hypothetical protein